MHIMAKPLSVPHIISTELLFWGEHIAVPVNVQTFSNVFEKIVTNRLQITAESHLDWVLEFSELYFYHEKTEPYQSCIFAMQ